MKHPPVFTDRKHIPRTGTTAEPLGRSTKLPKEAPAVSPSQPIITSSGNAGNEKFDKGGFMVNIWLIYGWYMVNIWLIYG